MLTFPAQLPDFETLLIGLKAVFDDTEQTDGEVTIVDRQTNAYTSTSPSEIVTCKFYDGRESKLFCKYGFGYFVTTSRHQRGVPYELEVYRELLQRAEASTPVFWGGFTDNRTGSTWLVTEYLERSTRLNEVTCSRSIVSAASWIGRFHFANKDLSLKVPMSFLNNYDAEYYSAWGRQFSIISAHFGKQIQWLSMLYERSVDFITPLLVAEPTIIHGEYYPNNVLIQNSQVIAIDWESAGIGAGEIDLAALTQGEWPAEIIRECELEYQRARWPEGASDQFAQTLAAARLYFHFQLLFHWLEFQPERLARETWLFERLYTSGERLGLL